MEDSITNLSPEMIRSLSERYAPVIIRAEWDFSYDGQIPTGAVILLDGEAALTKKNRIKRSILPGTIFGAKELLTSQPAKYGYRLREHSKVIVLPKSELLKGNYEG